MNTDPGWWSVPFMVGRYWFYLGFQLNLNKNWVLGLGFNPRSYKIIVYYFVCHNFLFYDNFPFLFFTTILPMFVVSGAGQDSGGPLGGRGEDVHTERQVCLPQGPRRTRKHLQILLPDQVCTTFYMCSFCSVKCFVKMWSFLLCSVWQRVFILDLCHKDCDFVFIFQANEGLANVSAIMCI